MRVILHGEVVRPGLCCSPTSAPAEWQKSFDVGLVDGGVPTIEGVEASIPLEPAVWSKVVVVDAVCFDVIKKRIQWTMCGLRNCTQRITGDQCRYQRCKHTQECLLTNACHPLVVDMQRGIDLVKRILVRQDDKDNVDLLHLLHVYILPIIELHSEDKEHVTKALTNQEQTIANLNGRIEKWTEQRRESQQCMRQWRAEMCEQLQSEVSIASCNSFFLELLCKHLEADLQYGYVELETWKKKIEEAKLRVRSERGRCCISQLKEARVMKDAVEDRMAKLLYVTVAGVALGGSRKAAEQKISDTQEAYIQLQSDWKDHTKELHELLRRKVCAVSVREALCHMLLELTQRGQTIGVEFISGGTQQPTDVLKEQSLPEEWGILQGQFAKSLESNPIINKLDRKFSDWIHNYCTDELGGSSPTKSNSSSLKKKGQFDDASWRIPPRNSSIRQSIRKTKPATHYKGLTKTLQDRLHRHINKVVQALVADNAEFSKWPNEVWIWYERSFFSSHYQNILKIYEQAYARETKEVKSNLPTFTFQDISNKDEELLQILGLYAPEFLSEDADKVKQLGQAKNKDVNRRSSEPWASVQRDKQVVLRRKGSCEQVSKRRGSHRKTQILDMTWVSPSSSEPASTGSGPDNSHSDKEPTSHPSEAFRSEAPQSVPIDIPNAASSGPQVPSVHSPSDSLNVTKEDVAKDDGSGPDNSNSDKEPTSHPSEASRSEPQSLPIDIPDTAGSHSSPQVPSVHSPSDSLNVTKEDVANDDVFEPMEAGHSSSDSPDKRIQDTPNSPVFRQRFQKAYNYFRDALQVKAPTNKLLLLFKCLREIETTAKIQIRLISSSKDQVSGMTTDELTTCIIVFLLHGDVKLVANGYHQIEMLNDYMPEFLHAGSLAFTGIEFLAAYLFLLRRGDPSG